jgi:hypothetical protein
MSRGCHERRLRIDGYDAGASIGGFTWLLRGSDIQLARAVEED